MTDVSDRATELEEMAREDALNEQHRRFDIADKTLADSAMHCCECDEPIPLARREAIHGVQTCIECQTLIEKGRL